MREEKRGRENAHTAQGYLSGSNFHLRNIREKIILQFNAVCMLLYVHFFAKFFFVCCSGALVLRNKGVLEKWWKSTSLKFWIRIWRRRRRERETFFSIFINLFHFLTDFNLYLDKKIDIFQGEHFSLYLNVASIGTKKKSLFSFIFSSSYSKLRCVWVRET